MVFHILYSTTEVCVIMNVQEKCYKSNADIIGTRSKTADKCASFSESCSLLIITEYTECKTVSLSHSILAHKRAMYIIIENNSVYV